MTDGGIVSSKCGHDGLATVGSEEIRQGSSVSCVDMSTTKMNENEESEEEEWNPEEEYLYCCRAGDVDGIQEILRPLIKEPLRLSKLLETRDDNGNSSVHLAAANGHVDILQILLSEPYDIDDNFVNNTNSGGNTPLHWAVRNRQTCVVRLLCGYGSDSNSQRKAVDILQKNSFKRSALNEAFNLTPPDMDILQILLEHPSANSLEHGLSAATTNGDCKDQTGNISKEYERHVGSANGHGVRSDLVNGSVVDDNQKASSGISSELDETKMRTSSAASVNLSTDASDIVEEVTHVFSFSAKKFKEDNGPAVSRSDSTVDTHVILCREVGLQCSVPRDTRACSPTVTKERNVADSLTGRECGPCKCNGLVLNGDMRQDITGVHLWSAGIVACHWFSRLATQGAFVGKSVLELGAGCGTPGITTVVYSSKRGHTKREDVSESLLSVPLNASPSALKTPTSLTLTDLPDHTIKNLCQNILINQAFYSNVAHGNTEIPSDVHTAQSRSDAIRRCREMHKSGGTSGVGEICDTPVFVLPLDWCDKETWPKGACYDVLLGSDLVYDALMVKPLVSVIETLLAKPHGRLYYVYRMHRDGAKNLTAELSAVGLKCEEHSASDAYRANPFVDASQEKCDKFFNELSSDDFVLLRCGWR
eukprot:GHVQ01023907.1.p1 GENE.GHVQ01023907.1~~GHVQ01023907.1.p1  ORF type:complete len:648 (-),score=72.99 GHVQ01023907.1:1020-2963(-)